jgi:cell division protein FtsI/penicillin-binding protein 2
VPQLVLHTTAQNELVPPAGTVSVKPIVRNDLHLNEHALSVIREAMLADVEDPGGTGTRARVPGYRVCGKTGTAQVELHGSFHHHTVWFGSYAPAEDPHYTVVVMVDHEAGGSGGGTGAPIAGKIYERLKYRDQRLQAPRSTVAIR